MIPMLSWKCLSLQTQDTERGFYARVYLEYALMQGYISKGFQARVYLELAFGQRIHNESGDLVH